MLAPKRHYDLSRGLSGCVVAPIYGRPINLIGGRLQGADRLFYSQVEIARGEGARSLHLLRPRLLIDENKPTCAFIGFRPDDLTVSLAIFGASACDFLSRASIFARVLRLVAGRNTSWKGRPT